MFGLGALWPHGWFHQTAWTVLGAFGLILYLCPRNVFYLSTQLGNVKLLWPPLPTWPVALFAPCIVLQTAALMQILGFEAGAFSGALLAAGGILDAGLAEGTYDQRWHLLAVIMLNGGGWFQVATLYGWWSSPVWIGVFWSVVAAAAGMTAFAAVELI